MKQKYYIWFVGIVCIGSLLPFLELAFYNHPSADDYICTVPAMKWNPITMTLGWYYSWSSRYTSAFILSINPLVYKWLLGYQLNTWLLLFILGSGFFYWFRTTSSLSSKYTWVLSLLAVGVYVCSVPSVVEAFYYFGGAICYQPSNAMLLVLISWWYYKIPLPNLKSLSLIEFISLACQCFMLFLIAGNNEMAMMFGLAITGSLWLYLHVKSRNFHLGMSLLLFTSVVSAGLVVFSPATRFRMQASSSFDRSFLDVLIKSFFSYFENIAIWFSNPCFLFFLILMFWLPVSKKVPILDKRYLITLSFLSMFLSFFCFVPSYLGEGVVQGRTANALIFNFLLLFIINVTFWKRYFLSINFTLSEGLHTFLFMSFLCLTSFSLFLSANFLQAYEDLSTGSAKTFDKERSERALYVENSLSDSVWVPPLKHKPKTIFFGDIGIYPEPWYDNFYAQYHGKKFISLLKNKP